LPKKITPKPQLSDIVFRFLEEDSYSLAKYLCLIHAYINKGKKVPPELVKRFFKLFDQAGQKFKDYIDGFRNDAILIIEGLNCNFSIQVEERVKTKLSEILFLPPPEYRASQNDSTRYRVLTANDFINYFFSSLKNKDENEFSNILNSKKNFVYYAYEKLYDYLSQVPKKKQPADNLKYKLVAALGVSLCLFQTEKEFQKENTSRKYYSEFLVSKVSHHCKRKDYQLARKFLRK
jgi:hypothetical protein